MTGIFQSPQGPFLVAALALEQILRLSAQLPCFASPQRRADRLSKRGGEGVPPYAL